MKHAVEEVLQDVLEAARAHVPCDIERAGDGLEARVLTRLRREKAPAAGSLDDFGAWAWRCACGVAPAVALLVVWLCVWSGFSLEPFAYDVAGDLALYLPLSLQ